MAKEPDFVESLVRHGRDRNVYQFLARKERNLSKLFLLDVALFENLYALAKEYPSQQRAIPKIIHQIWLGGKIPQQYHQWMSSWQNIKGVDYKLWTDDNFREVPLTHRKLIESCANLGSKSDILRYEILLQYGGLYVDVDFECLSPEFFIRSFEMYDFFAGTELLSQALDFWIGNSLIGSVPQHQILKRVVGNLPQTCPSGNFSPVFLTGPGYFTQQFKLALLEEKGDPGHLVIFPNGFFQPISFNESLLLNEAQKIHMRFPETVAVHNFQRSWDRSFPSGMYLKGDRITSFSCSSTEPAIPKVFHQIDSFPNDSFRDRCMVSWMGIRGFDYQLWSQERLEEEFELSGLELDEPMTLEKLKFQILYRYGGIFVDTSLFCFDEPFFQRAVENYAFFAGWAPLADSEVSTVSSYLIGARRHHPLIKRCLDRQLDTQTSVFSDETVCYLKNDACQQDVVLPSSYFYPLTNQQTNEAKQHQQRLTFENETAAIRNYCPLVKKSIIY